MNILTFVFIGLFAVGVGALIGAVGIGGVLLVPVLTFFFGIDIHQAISAAMFSYLFSGGVGAWLYARSASIEWRQAFTLCQGALPGAFLGAAAAHGLSAQWLGMIIAGFVLFAGLNAMRQNRTRDDDEAEQGASKPHGFLLAFIGFSVGFGSALSGTGGPLILVPLLLLLRQPVLSAVGLSQAIQVPIAAAATAGNAAFGGVDWYLGLVIAVGLALGAVGGAKIVHLLSAVVLQRVVAWVLVAVGLFLMIKLVLA